MLAVVDLEHPVGLESIDLQSVGLYLGSLGGLGGPVDLGPVVDLLT